MILVTGGTGFLGFHLLKKLLKQNERPIRATYRATSDPKVRERLKGIEWVEADVLDVVALEEAMQGVTQVYHAAAVVSFAPNKRKAMQHINIEGTANVVNAALDANVEKLLHVSSVAALGRKPNQVIVHENIEWEASTNNSAYAKSKYGAEMEIWRGIAEGLNAVIVNPSIILGPWDWDTGSAAFFKRAWNNSRFYTTGIKGFIDVEDVVVAMVQLMNSEVHSQRFILNSENISFKQLFDWLAYYLHKQPPPYKAGKFISEIAWRVEAIRAFFTKKDPIITKETANSANTHYEYDNTKFLRIFPEFRFTPIEESIKRTSQVFLMEVSGSP